jgi:tripartite-type tricarboxylate transporter receptor subunit TctC
LAPLVPDLPGMIEAGLPEYNLEFCYGVLVPAGTPAAIVTRIHEAVSTTMQQANVKAALARQVTEVALSGSPDAFGKFLVEDGKFWVNLAKGANVTVD